MKIIKPETIHINEEEFIDTINAELDWEVIENMLLEKHKFVMQEDVDYKKGDLVVYHDQVAYRFDFDIRVPLSVVFGRDGKCLELSTSGSLESEFNKDSDGLSDSLVDGQLNDDELMNDGGIMNLGDFTHNNSETSDISGKQDISKMAANIADMISDINQSDINQADINLGDD